MEFKEIGKIFTAIINGISQQLTNHSYQYAKDEAYDVSAKYTPIECGDVLPV